MEAGRTHRDLRSETKGVITPIITSSQNINTFFFLYQFTDLKFLQVDIRGPGDTRADNEECYRKKSLRLAQNISNEH